MTVRLLRRTTPRKGVKKLAILNVKVSDISGAHLKDDDCVRVIVRGHPKLSEDKQLDAATGELDALKTVANLVNIEVQYPDGTTKDVAATAAELEKVIPFDVLEGADGLRGRRRNWRPQD